ncbi:TrpB-like pyridoxal phosphate-dependent enzyme [Candidatus Borrarchaeum sp.]|uniref:TrpB-like pyridoxal phosphate-dependent enzyme n=1 Tax=Candidatus Borrarchaeum sp. TaxID=2846742 RepID=UPI00257E7FC1|nr:TrpB-like pyridoxal phosphate-dependent enzyme [Candidatus Borrarchaeum sp.]
MKEVKIQLPVKDLPKSWYNIIPDLPQPLPPPKEPETGPSRLEFLSKVIVKECLKQEFSDQSWVPIPEELRELYIQAGRPRPLRRAKRLEKLLKTPAHLYWKREDLSPTGSHKVNTALAQLYYAVQEGVEGVVTETGAGQWGTALSYGASLMELPCVVFWVRNVHDWKVDRRTLMKMYGGEVHPSPNQLTEVGRTILKENPDHPGSLGIAISEGLEYAEKHDGYAYSLGSVLNHVLMHQTIIGLETIEQFNIVDEQPDLLIGCFGGGSNFGGFTLPFIGEVLNGKRECEFLASQSLAAPNISQGEYRYDFADHAGKTPLLKMYTLGHDSNMPPIFGDGLRYSGASPILSLLRNLGHIKTRTYPVDEKDVFEATRTFLQTEGFLPAPESSYAIRAMIDEAIECKKTGEEKTIACNVSGHGFLDIFGYKSVLNL